MQKVRTGDYAVSGVFMRANNKTLKTALTEIDATPLQRKMAAILMAVNGEASVMKFVKTLKAEKKKEAR